MDFQAGICCRGPNQTDHDFQWHALPGPRDMAERPMLNLVPLARPRWIVTQFKLQPGFIGELLKNPAPQSGSGTVPGKS